MDRVVVLEQGKIVLDGNYYDIKDSEYIKKIVSIHKSNTNQDEAPAISLDDADESFTAEDLSKERKVIKKTLDFLDT